MIPLLDLAVRIEQRLDQIIHRRAGANRGQVRPHFSTYAPNGVASDTAEFRPAENFLAPRRVALRCDRGRDLLNFGGRQRQFGIVQTCAAREGKNQLGLVAPALACGAQTRLGGRRGETACWQSPRERSSRAFDRSEEHTSELQSHSFISYAV